MKHIIIGASAAGISAAKTIRQWAPNDEITLISIDTQIHSRCMLHKFLSHERDAKKINFVPDNFFELNNIRWVKGEKVSGIDAKSNTVLLECNAHLHFDKLLIATGANFVIPPLPNFRTAKNVFGLRDLSDAIKIDNAAQNAKEVIIVGSGLVGLDAAYALLERGIAPTVIEMADRVLPLQMDYTSAKEYQMRFEKAGCKFKLGVKAENSEIDANGNIINVSISTGEKINCDFVIVAAGVRPAISFLQDSDIKIERSIVVDKYMQTSCKDIYAAGDVTGLSGIWPNAMKQGETAAKNMCGAEVEYDDLYCIKNTINFFNLVSLSIGDISSKDETYKELIKEDKKNYKKIIMHNGCVTGIILQGDISNSGIWQYIIKNKIDITKFKKSLFDLSFADFYQFELQNGTYEWAI